MMVTNIHLVSIKTRSPVVCDFMLPYGKESSDYVPCGLLFVSFIHGAYEPSTHYFKYRQSQPKSRGCFANPNIEFGLGTFNHTYSARNTGPTSREKARPAPMRYILSTRKVSRAWRLSSPIQSTMSNLFCQGAARFKELFDPPNEPTTVSMDSSDGDDHNTAGPSHN